MSYKSYVDFYYDGKLSTNYKLINISVETGLYEEPFLASRDIKETVIRGKDKPYFHEVIRSPLILNLSFAFTETWNDELIREIARWLDISYYAPLYFVDNPDNVYYAMLTSDSSLLHNGLQQGYVKLQFRTNAPYCYSREFTQNYDTGILQVATTGTNNTTLKLTNHGLLTNDYIKNLTKNDAVSKVTKVDANTLTLTTSISGQLSGDMILKYPAINTNNIEFINIGDLNCEPKFYINKIGNGAISIINTTNSNKTTSFSAGVCASGNLNFFESVYDGEIITIGSDTYEFDTTDGIVETGNNLVDLSGGNTATASSILTITNYVYEKETITIGEDTYEFCLNNTPVSGNIPIDISNFATNAVGALTLNSNPLSGETIQIGDIIYTFEAGTTANNLYLPNHGISTSSVGDLIINTKRDATVSGIRYLEVIDENNLNLVTSAGVDSPITNQTAGDTIDFFARNNEFDFKPERTISMDNYTFYVDNNDKIGSLKKGDVLCIEAPVGGSPDIYWCFVDSIVKDYSFRYTVTVTPSIGMPTDANGKVYVKTGTKKATNALNEGGYKVLVGNTIADTLINLNAAINESAAVSDLGTDELKIKITNHNIKTSDLLYNTSKTQVADNIRVAYIRDDNIYNNSQNLIFLKDPANLANIMLAPPSTLSGQIATNTINVYKGDPSISCFTKTGSDANEILLDETGTLVAGDILVLWDADNDLCEARFISNVITDTKITVSEDFTFDVLDSFAFGYHLNTSYVAEAASSVSIVPGEKYSVDIIKHPSVFSNYVSSISTQLNIHAINPGFAGNFISTFVKSTDSLNKFAYATLINGTDCNASNALILLKNIILFNNISKVNNILIDKFELYEPSTLTSTTLTILAKYAGTKGNSIIVSSNLKYGYWNHDTLSGGDDPTITEIITALTNKINSLSVLYDATSYISDYYLKITYSNIGFDGNVPVTTTCENAYWDNITLTSGSDELINGENIFVNNESKIIESDVSNVYRHNIFNNVWFEALRGNNFLQLVGNFTLQIVWRCKMLQGV